MWKQSEYCCLGRELIREDVEKHASHVAGKRKESAYNFSKLYLVDLGGKIKLYKRAVRTCSKSAIVSPKVSLDIARFYQKGSQSIGIGVVFNLL